MMDGGEGDNKKDFFFLLNKNWNGRKSERQKEETFKYI